MPLPPTLENELDGGHRPVPIASFTCETLFTGASDDVVLRAAIVVGRSPFSGHPAALLEALEDRIERALVDVERVARELLDALADSPAVHRLEGQGLEHEHLEGAWNERDRVGHGSPLGYP